MIRRFIFFALLSMYIQAESIKEIEHYKLDPQLVHTIYCHERNTGVTTVVFPAEITAIYAARVDVKFNEKKPNPFLLSFTPGSSYFTIKSLSSNNAAGAINVVFEKKVFVIHLKTVKKGHSSVSFLKAQKPKAVSALNTGKRSGVSTAHLLSMLDKAKAYHLIKKHYPTQAESISYDAPGSIMDYSSHQILLKEVFRFDQQDAVFFHIQIKNKLPKELSYSPKDIAVNVSNKIFYSALTDASGKIPAEGQSSAWFCIQASKSGGRNNLAVKNDWKVLLNVSHFPKISRKKPAPKKEIEQKSRLIKTLKDVEVEDK